MSTTGDKLQATLEVLADTPERRLRDKDAEVEFRPLSEVQDALDRENSREARRSGPLRTKLRLTPRG